MPFTRHQRVPPGYRFPYGHTHSRQEEVYVVVRGSGRMKLDDEIVEPAGWTGQRQPSSADTVKSLRWVSVAIIGFSS